MRTKLILKYSSLLLFVFLFSKTISAQCFEIESILVNACGSVEGENEMVKFSIGTAPLNTANLNVNWTTNNSWLGIAPNNQTNSKVNQINATITNGCGVFIQPTAGVLRAGATVLFITSTDFNVGVHDFSNITDTIFIIFQNAGNTGGHFGNNGNDTITFSMDFGVFCTDTVKYERSMLSNTDGASVEFTANGTATFSNSGCTVPAKATKVDAGNNASVCRNSGVTLNGVSENTLNVFWSGGSGTFSDKNIDKPNYTPGAADMGTIKLYFNARTPCDTITDSLLLTINELPTAQIIGSIATVCYNVGEVVNLNATSANATSVLWTTSGTGTIINANTNNASYTILAADVPMVQFIFTATNANCTAKDTFSNCVVAVFTPQVIAAATPNPVCEGEMVQLMATVINGMEPYFYIWSPATGLNKTNIANPTFISDKTITYKVVAINLLGQIVDSTTVLVMVNAKPILTTSGDITIKKGDNATLTASGGFSYAWSGGEGLSCYDCANPIASPESTTTYQVKASNANGCSDSSSVTVTVELDSFKLEIPNVFTPNGDGKNDVFEFSYSGVKRFNILIFNRWGEKIYENEKTLTERWKGNYNSGTTVPDGIYIYIIEAEDTLGKIYQRNGTVAVYK